MAEPCCLPPPQPAFELADGVCPGCGGRGRPVVLATVQAQVAISLRELAQGGYYFCSSAGCAIVYFTSCGSAIHHDQLRERVFQKEPRDDVLVCYCFRYRVDTLQRSGSAERAAILADIVAGTQQGQCACDIRNPQGSCCLGNVRGLIMRGC
jgi:hypothetical protein